MIPTEGKVNLKINLCSKCVMDKVIATDRRLHHSDEYIAPCIHKSDVVSKCPPEPNIRKHIHFATSPEQNKIIVDTIKNPHRDSVCFDQLVRIEEKVLEGAPPVIRDVKIKWKSIARNTFRRNLQPSVSCFCCAQLIA